MTEKIKLNEKNLNLRSGCYWYPCHKGININDYDCRACYCPLYEECSIIQNENLGGYLLKYKDKKGR